GEGNPVTALTTALLDGFIIEKGNANGEETGTPVPLIGSGGGIMNRLASPTLQNLIIRDNYGTNGGGIHNRGANPVLNNVTITNNASASGGGVYNQHIVAAGTFYSEPIFDNVQISDNTA